MFEVKVVEDSLSPGGVRLTTLTLKYPRAIHAELMTHRMFSRNASSSRAIPVRKIRQDARTGMMWPVWWGANQPGMQARAELTGWRLTASKLVWAMLGYVSIAGAWTLDKLGLHKQIANRVIEPFSHITVVLTGTEDAFGNFFNLRCHPDAQPEMHVLAERVYEALQASTPKKLYDGDWHLPFVSAEERQKHTVDKLLRLSVARCARVSYLNHDGSNPDPGKDVKLHDDLLKAPHISPFEHQATPSVNSEKASGNLTGWIQYRKTFPNEYRPVYERK